MVSLGPLEELTGVNKGTQKRHYTRLLHPNASIFTRWSRKSNYTPAKGKRSHNIWDFYLGLIFNQFINKKKTAQHYYRLHIKYSW